MKPIKVAGHKVLCTECPRCNRYSPHKHKYAKIVFDGRAVCPNCFAWLSMEAAMRAYFKHGHIRRILDLAHGVGTK